MIMAASLPMLACGGGSGEGDGEGTADTGLGAYQLVLSSSGLVCAGNVLGETVGADLFAPRVPVQAGDEVRLDVYAPETDECTDFTVSFFFTATSATSATADDVNYYVCALDESYSWGFWEFDNATLTVTGVDGQGVPTGFTVQGGMWADTEGLNCFGSINMSATLR